MTERKKINKITEEEYWPKETPSGEIVFLPPLPDDVPFKTVITYDADNKPYQHNYYNRDGTVYCPWTRNMSNPFDEWKSVYRIVETRSNDNGQTIYERQEPYSDKKELAIWLSQERFYEYRDGMLFREKMVRELSPTMVDYDSILYVDKGYDLPLIDCREMFYNEKGDHVIYRCYGINSSQISHESTCRYLYDHYGNMIYREDIDSSGKVWRKTYRTIKYWDSED